jgi:predicted O-methyltransferase YrrM
VGRELWGPDFVRSELKKVGFKGKLELVSGNSHDTIPGYFRQHPDAYFDLITVDGDHSYRGASMDLRDVLPRLNIGGVVVFDDIASPQAVYLRDVWKRYVANQSRFANWEFNELGFGIALGIRKY